MKKKTDLKQTIYYVIMILAGAVALWLVINHIIGWKYQAWFFKAYPDVKKYSGTNIVAPLADLSYFTYQTIIIFAIWCIATGASGIMNLKLVNAILRSKNVVCFVITNYIITALFYTAYELFIYNSHFGLYADTPAAWHSFGTNIIAHYILFAFSIFFFFNTKIQPSEHKKSGLFIAGYLLLYIVAVKITGMFCYSIEWYPYPIFDAELFGQILGITSYTLSVLLVIVSFALLSVSYFFIFKLLNYIALRKKEYFYVKSKN